MEREEAGHVIEALIHCTEASCQAEFPVIDGIPVIVPNVRRFVSDQILAVCQRSDLGDAIESLVGDCAGPGSAFDQIRQHLSTYAWGHYSDLDSGKPGTQESTYVQLVEGAVELAGELPAGPLLDLGCSAGRGAFELAARLGRPVLGVDLNFSMLRLASGVLRTGLARYPRRRIGLVYDRHETPCEFANAEQVDFWACDALALPFADNTFACTLNLNLLDSVVAPRDLLGEIARILRPGGKAALACPYDWSSGVTAPEAWIGGHSQRAPQQGSPEAHLRALLTGDNRTGAIAGLRLTGERDGLPWNVRLHDRSSVAYRVHMVAAERP